MRPFTLIRCLPLALCLSTAALAADASAVFEAAKRSRPELVAFLKAMPKGADLHDHLDGSTWPEFTLDSAIRNGLNYDLKAVRFTKATGDGIVPASRLRDDDGLYQIYRNAFTMRQWMPTDAPGRDHFFNVFLGIASSGRTEAEMLKEEVERAADQNLQYAELIAPVVPWPTLGDLKARLGSLDMKDLDAAYRKIAPMLDDPAYAKMISARFDGWERDAGYDRKATSHKVNYIHYVLRVGPLEDFFVSAAAGMAAQRADARAVATNIVMPEDHLDATAKFDDQMKIMDFLWKKLGKPDLALHAGEFTLNDVAPVTMERRIRTTIEKGHAKRIGHGVSIAWEDDAYGLLKEMAAKKVMVEICLSSNEMILGIAGRDHPFDLYRRFGVPMSLNTDDEGISRSPITMEFVKAVEWYNLDYQDVLTLARNSLEYSFLKGESLYANGDYGRIRPDFADLPATPSAAQNRRLDANPKLAEELRFERALAAFEAKIEKTFTTMETPK